MDPHQRDLTDHIAYGMAHCQEPIRENRTRSVLVGKLASVKVAVQEGPPSSVIE